jgi:CheY-like chemotaxis protein
LTGRPLVVVADDDDRIRELVRLVLEGERLEVREARNGAEAIQVLREVRPIALLLDLAMPGVSGLDAADEIRRLHPDLPVIIFSASMASEAQAFGNRVRAAARVPKPFDIDELLAAIKPFLPL